MVEGEEDKIRVKVGSVEHSMLVEHYIEWIEIVSGDKGCRVFLKPGSSPVATFPTEEWEGNLTLRAY